MRQNEGRECGATLPEGPRYLPSSPARTSGEILPNLRRQYCRFYFAQEKLERSCARAEKFFMSHLSFTFWFYCLDNQLAVLNMCIKYLNANALPVPLKECVRADGRIDCAYLQEVLICIIRQLDAAVVFRQSG